MQKKQKKLAGEPWWIDWIKFPSVVRQLQFILLHSQAADGSQAADQTGTKDFQLKPTSAPGKSSPEQNFCCQKKNHTAI